VADVRRVRRLCRVRAALRAASRRTCGPFVCTALRAAALRAAADRRRAAVLAWRASACLDAAARPSRLSTANRTRPPGRGPSRSMPARPCGVLGALLRSCFRAGWWTRELHAGAPRLRETDRDRLFRRSRPVLAFANVVHFLTNELAGLCRWRSASALRLASTCDGGFFGHTNPPI
jgi:hypothetical protein